MNSVPRGSWHLERGEKAAPTADLFPVSRCHLFMFDNITCLAKHLWSQNEVWEGLHRNRSFREKETKNVSAERTLEIILFKPHVLVVRKQVHRGNDNYMDNCYVKEGIPVLFSERKGVG